MFNEIYNPTMDKLEVFLREHYIFWKNTLTHPFQTGSLSPSTKAGIEGILEGIDFGEKQVFIELGPGTGAVTKEICDRKNKDSIVVCLEIEPTFCNALEKRLQDYISNKDLAVIQTDAVNIDVYVRTFSQMYPGHRITIVSCLPLRTMKKKKREAILRNAHDALAPGEMFKQIQYCQKTWEGTLKDLFGYVKVTKVPLILPPFPFFGVWTCEFQLPSLFDTNVYTCIKQKQKQQHI